MDPSTSWLSSHYLGLSGLIEKEWNEFIFNLQEVGIYFKDEPDSLVWAGNKVDGSVTAILGYSFLLNYYMTY